MSLQSASTSLKVRIISSAASRASSGRPLLWLWGNDFEEFRLSNLTETFIATPAQHFCNACQVDYGQVVRSPWWEVSRKGR